MSHRSSSPPSSSSSFSSLLSSTLSYLPSAVYSSTLKRFHKSSGAEPLLPSVSLPPSDGSPQPPLFSSFNGHNHTRKPSDFDPAAISTFTSSLPLSSISGAANTNPYPVGGHRRGGSSLANEKGGPRSCSLTVAGWTKGRMGNVLFALVFWICLIWWARALGGWGVEISSAI